MIKDQVNTTMARRPGPYESTSFCDGCHCLKPLAKLVVPFRPPLNVCRECRRRRTGIDDQRDVVVATATIALPPVRIAGLLTARCESDLDRDRDVRLLIQQLLAEIDELMQEEESGVVDDSLWWAELALGSETRNERRIGGGSK